MPPLQDGLCYFGREKSQTERTGDIGPIKPLGACDVADTIRLATNNLTKPFMRSRDRLDEVGIGLGSTVPLVENNELRFDASPPKP